MTDTQFAETLQAITDATATVADNDSLFRQIPQVVIAAIVVVVWGLTIAAIVVWTIWNGLGSSQFICNTPPASGSGPGTDCINGWTATKDQLKDVFTFGVLPFVTLVLGFYFGQQSTVAES